MPFALSLSKGLPRASWTASSSWTCFRTSGGGAQSQGVL